MASNEEKQTYTAAELKKIGEQCESDFPPARILQQMLQYELHCQAKNEKLFTHQLIHLTTMEGTTNDTKRRLSSLDTRITATNAMMSAGQAAWKSHDKQLVALKIETANHEKNLEAQNDKLVDITHTIEQVKTYMYETEQRRTALEASPTRSLFDSLDRQIALLNKQNIENKTALQQLSQQHSNMYNYIQNTSSDVLCLQNSALQTSIQQNTFATYIAELAAKVAPSATVSHDVTSATAKELNTRMSDLETLIRDFTTQLAFSIDSPDTTSNLDAAASSTRPGLGVPKTSSAAAKSRPVSSLMGSRYAS